MVKTRTWASCLFSVFCWFFFPPPALLLILRTTWWESALCGGWWGVTVSGTAQARLTFGKATEFRENRKAILPRFAFLFSLSSSSFFFLRSASELRHLCSSHTGRNDSMQPSTSGHIWFELHARRGEWLSVCVRRCPCWRLASTSCSLAGFPAGKPLVNKHIGQDKQVDRQI